MPFSAMMGEIEQSCSRSGIQLNGHDHKRHFMLMFSFHSSVNCVRSSPGVRRRYWTQTYSLEKLLHSSCLYNALSTRVIARTRKTSKRKHFLYPSQIIGKSSWRCLKAQSLDAPILSYQARIFMLFSQNRHFPKP